MWSSDRGALYHALIPTLAPSLLVTASVALMLTGCAGAGDVTTRLAPPRQSGASADSVGPAAAMAGGPESNNMSVSPRQRGYLDTLAAAGVRRSSELMALSIGSYVCQGRAAGQSDQAVWDFVFPLVRGDVDSATDTDSAIETPDADSNTDGAAATQLERPEMSARAATVQYIRIATERLC